MSEETTIQQDVDIDITDTVKLENDLALDDDQNNPQDADMENESVSERDQIMQSMSEKRRRQNAGLSFESEDIIENDSTPGDLIEPIENEMITLKVNGQDIVKTKEEVDAAGGIVAIQKSLSGDMKLAQASMERKKLDQERADFERAKVDINKQQIELEKATQQVRNIAEENKGASDKEIKELRKTKALKIAEALYLGDSDNIAKAVEEILESASRPVVPSAPVVAPVAPINEDDLVRKVATSVLKETDRKDAIKMFETEHVDLNTVGRRKYVNQLTVDIARANPDMMPSDIVKKAVKQARLDLDIPVPKKKKPSKVDLDSKRETKRKSVDRIPIASQRGKGPQPTKPKTKREIFEQMNSRRSHA